MQVWSRVDLPDRVLDLAEVAERTDRLRGSFHAEIHIRAAKVLH